MSSWRSSYTGLQAPDNFQHKDINPLLSERVMTISFAFLLLICSARGFYLASPALSMTTERSQDAVSRRGLLSSGSAFTAAALVAGASASPALAQTFTDSTLGVTFEVPDEWEKAEQEISGRRRVVIYTSGKAQAFVAYTPIKGDFTSLGSFGTLDEVSRTVLPSGKGVESTLIDLKSKAGKYEYEYTVRQESRPEKHIRTAWAVVQGGMNGDFLVTLTAQCDQADYPANFKTLESIIRSYSIKK